jgi:hypothetical protein
MKTFLIPWHEFLEALGKQQPNTLEAWLRRWHFANEGVILPELNKQTPKSVRGSSPGLAL